ncbi:hypothetical protein WAE58_21835 [Pedobacter panaciterrae]|uniref:DUF4843 domain-containing protein n=1 Tax=Pedobacter panaciterrae TaxID=363849 RepID=A0ABU8NUE9_9SPHI
MKKLVLLSAIVFLGFTRCTKDTSTPEKNIVTYLVEGNNVNVTVAPLMPRYFTLVPKSWNYSVSIYSGTTAYLEVRLSDLGLPQKVKAAILINGRVVKEINEMIGYNETKVISYKMP